jgi:fructose-bisphosphate aldolase, class I
VDIEQLEKISQGRGFVAALDQSGGSTPKALAEYGIPESAYSSEDEMFDLVHQMRSRIILSPSFGGDRVLAAILFQNTIERQIEGQETAAYLWKVKGIVPILKVDRGLAPETDGVQLMRPIPDLDALLDEAVEKGAFGTKMRSFIKQPDPVGVKAISNQQFELAHRILAAGLVPILEPEIDIRSPGKAEAETLLKAALQQGLDGLAPGQQVMIKLSLPSQDDFYADLVSDERVMRVLALSGGYTRAQAVELLARNHGVIASFSRALLEGLSAQQSDEEFDRTLDETVESIFRASLT